MSSNLVRGLAAAVAALPVLAQTPSRGFATASRYVANGGGHDIAAMAVSRGSDALFVAHRDQLFAVDSQGNSRLVHSLGAGEWFGALLVDPANGDVLFTNWTTNTLWAFDPSRGQARLLGGVPNNSFDLAFLPGTSTLLTTANPLWPAPGAHPSVWRIDPAGNHHEVVQLSGSSGPLAFAANGDLVCVTVSDVYPPPPGSSQVLRFAATLLARALGGGSPLRESDAAAVGRPFDGAYDLALDDRGRAYLSDAGLGQVWQLDLASGLRTALPLLDTGSAATTVLAWTPGPGPATFDAYQHDGGGALFATVTDWTNMRTSVERVAAAAPTVEVAPSNPVPRGSAAVNVAGAEPSALCVLFVSELAPVAAYSAFTWQGAPMLFMLDPTVAPFAWAGLADAGGRATWAFTHGGLGGVSFTVQALTLAPDRAGTTLPLRLTLAP
ncbi:MAG: hypothetical protein R3F56_13410 [Planctomycetota bacterium]